MANEIWLGWTDKLKMFIDLLSSDQKDKLLEILLQEDKEKKKNYWAPNPDLVWDYDRVLMDIRSNCITTTPDQELFWLHWFKKSLKLPAVWNFEWFEINIFCCHNKAAWLSNDYNTMLYSMDDIWHILQKIDEYLREYWVYSTASDYVDMLKSWKHWENYVWCRAARVLTYVLHCPIWLSDVLPNDCRVYLDSWGGEKLLFKCGRSLDRLSNNITLKL